MAFVALLASGQSIAQNPVDAPEKPGIPAAINGQPDTNAPDTAAGRQLNRRVELIVSGELIGTQIALSFGSQ